MKIDNQIKGIIANLNDKLMSITTECNKEEAYPEYIDEKLKSIEWDIKVLRNKVNVALLKGEELYNEK
jgi:hypothetical protein